MNRYLRIAIIAAVVVAAIFLFQLFIRLGYGQSWTGFSGYREGGEYYPTKTLWDWLDLLIIPLVLVIGGYFLNRAERGAEREAADDRNRETALQAYLDKMTELIVDKGLLESDPEDPKRDIARARTLAVLRSLDAERKASVMRFLIESKLIGGEESPVIVLSGADLRGAHLRGAYLEWANLEAADLRGAYLFKADLSRAWCSKADLRGANLYEADLSGAYLGEADLFKADLFGANLGWAHLRGADLSGANLSGANLSKAWCIKADLSGADLRGADLRGAHLPGADLTGADLSGADLIGADLSGAKYDSYTKWPEGFTPPPEAIKED